MSIDIISKARIQQIVELLSVEEMRNYLRENANSESHKASFVRYHRDYFEDEVDPTPYIEQVRKIYRDATNEEGEIPEDDQFEVEYKAEEVLSKADELCAIGCYSAAFKIYFETLRLNTRALWYSPLCCDFLENVSYIAIETLKNFYDEECYILDSASRKALMGECRKFIRRRPSQKDWKRFEASTVWEIYDILIHLSKTDKEFTNLQNTILKDCRFEAKDHDEEYRAELLKNLTEAWENQKDTLDKIYYNYLEREDEIRIALRLRNYKMAYELCDLAIRYKCEGYQASRNWLEWRIRIAQAERNKDLIVATAKEIYQQTRFHDEKSYALLKETIYKYEWEAFIEDFAQTIKLDQYSDKFAYICIEEGWHDRLLQFLQTSGDLEKIRRFQAYLLPSYSNELAQLYIDHAKGLMRIPNPQQKTYFQLRRVLQWAQEMGGTEKVKSLIEEARTQYGDKPLLLAALDRI